MDVEGDPSHALVELAAPQSTPTGGVGCGRKERVWLVVITSCRIVLYGVDVYSVEVVTLARF